MCVSTQPCSPTTSYHAGGITCMNPGLVGGNIAMGWDGPGMGMGWDGPARGPHVLRALTFGRALKRLAHREFWFLRSPLRLRSSRRPRGCAGVAGPFAGNGAPAAAVFGVVGLVANTRSSQRPATETHAPRDRVERWRCYYAICVVQPRSSSSTVCSRHILKSDIINSVVVDLKCPEVFSWTVVQNPNKNHKMHGFFCTYQNDRTLTGH